MSGLSLGAVDYIVKPFDIKKLRAKIHSLLRFQEALVKASREQVMDMFKDNVANYQYEFFEKNCLVYNITEREKEVIILVYEGLPYKTIAGKLDISFKTVLRHIENIYEKMEVHAKLDMLNKLFRQTEDNTLIS